MMANNLRFNHPGYTLVSHLFRQFLAEEDLDTSQAENLSIRRFYKWANDRKAQNAGCECPLFPDKEQLQEVYDIEEIQFEFISGIFDDPFDVSAHLYSWWPLLCLSGRPPLKNKILATSLSVSVRFEDGVTAHFPMPLGSQPEPYTDGLVLSLWRGQLFMLGHMIKNKSLDKVHDDIVKAGLTMASIEVEIVDDIESDIGLCKGEGDYDDNRTDTE